MSYKQVALYARVSSEQQVDSGTIKSQVAALHQRIKQDGFEISEELTLIDKGYSGATLIRPALEKLRDLIALHSIDCVYVHSPDRLARKYAYQVLLLDEFQRAGVEVIFLTQSMGQSPEEHLLLQVQGMIAEYERAKILERSRRGKRHAAHAGKISVLSGAPYGYHYVTKQEGDREAKYEIISDEAQVVRQIFQWIGRERLSIGEVCRRLKKTGKVTRTGKTTWDRSFVSGLLKNPAYKGMAAFGKTRIRPIQPRLRPQRNRPPHPRRAISIEDVPVNEWIYIPVPALIEEALFDIVQQQLENNQRRNRQSLRGASYLLQGLTVCTQCKYAYYGKSVSKKSAKGKQLKYGYYRCIGMDGYRFGGERICDNLQVRTDTLDQLIWDEVCALLSEPDRIEQELQRRIQASRTEKDDLTVNQAQISKLRKAISRLIDSYTEGLITKEEFESRITRLRERVMNLEQQVQEFRNEEDLLTKLHLLSTQFENFAQQVRDGLEKTDWNTRRDLIRTLVKQIEIGKEEVKVVFRIEPIPFESTPKQQSLKKSLQHCRWRDHTTLRSPFPSRVPSKLLHDTTF